MKDPLMRMDDMAIAFRTKIPSKRLDELIMDFRMRIACLTNPRFRRHKAVLPYLTSMKVPGWAMDLS